MKSSWQLHTRRELGPAVMPAQGFDNRSSRVHQSERIAGLDHAFVPVGRSVEIRGQQVVNHTTPERQRRSSCLVDELLGTRCLAALPERHGEPC